MAAVPIVISRFINTQSRVCNDLMTNDVIIITSVCRYRRLDIDIFFLTLDLPTGIIDSPCFVDGMESMVFRLEDIHFSIFRQLRVWTIKIVFTS